MKRFICSLLSVLIIVCAVPFTAQASSNVINITEKQMNDNAYKYIENALKEAKNNATKEKPYVINVPSGNYTLKKALHIYSNTTLNLEDDTVLLKGFTDGNMIKLGVKEEANSGYEGYENVTVNGGVWNGNFKGACIMRFAHCKKITVKNCILQNQKNAHFLELAAANNFKITNCIFEGYLKTESTDALALQIDIIHNSAHFSAYEEYDDTPCKNITVSKCTFTDVYSGVGTRSGVVGSYFDNIKIKNNTFKDLSDIAISAFNFRNSEISGNKINSATMGITFQTFPDVNAANRLYLPNDKDADTDIIKDTNSVIKNNSITVYNTTYRGNSSGISVYGGSVSAEYAKEIKVKKGKYYAEGLVLSKNKIKVHSASSGGVIMEYANKCSLKDNSIISYSDSSADGIIFLNGDNNIVSGNTVKGFFNGISAVSGSVKNKFTKNVIKSNSNYAISVDKKSKALIYYGNTVKGNKKGKYHIKSKNYPLYAKDIKLNAEKSLSGNRLKWNKVKGVSEYKIYRSNKKNGTYKFIKTVKAKKSSYTDYNKKGSKYYYRIRAVKNVNGSKIYGKYSNKE